MSATRHKRRGPVTPVVGLAALAVGLAVLYVVLTAASGLPWDRPYRVSVGVPDAMRIATNSEVRIDGVRVGRISGVDVTRRAGGQPVARLDLAIDQSAAPLTTQTRVAVRSAATLGATFLDVMPSRAGRTVRNGGELPYHPIGTRSGSVTDLLDVFDASTRRGIRRGSRELAGAVAGRGIDMNQVIADLAVILPDFDVVLARLAHPDTQTARFIAGLASTTGALGEVSAPLAGAVRGGAVTLQAISRARGALAATLERAPQATDEATRALVAVTPALDDASALARTLRPSIRHLPRTARALSGALRAGPNGLRALTALLPPLRRTAGTLSRTARRPSVDATLQKLRETIAVVTPLADDVTAAQTHCNAAGLWLDGLSSPGFFIPGNFTMGNVLVTALGAQNELGQNAAPSPDVKIDFLPHENAQECESGNEPAPAGRQVLTNPAGLQPDHTRATHAPPDARERARQAGLLRVPRGGG